MREGSGALVGGTEIIMKCSMYDRETCLHLLLKVVDFSLRGGIFEATLDIFKAPVDLLKTPIHLCEALVDRFEAVRNHAGRGRRR